LSQEKAKNPFKRFFQDLKIMFLAYPLKNISDAKDIIRQSSNMTEKLIEDLKCPATKEKGDEKRCFGTEKPPLN